MLRQLLHPHVEPASSIPLGGSASGVLAPSSALQVVLEVLLYDLRAGAKQGYLVQG